MANERNPRYWYEYRGEKFLVPEQFVYKIHQGGYDINEAFFTWAFQKHSISIVDIQILYSDNDRSPKPAEKDKTVASSTFFVATVKGRDKQGIERVGDGEVGNESITNFQRKFPAGLAIKRAKVNMGKEFLGLVDLRLALDCQDFEFPFGEYKGKRLGEMTSTKEGMNTLKWIYSDKFTSDPILKMKVIELFDRLKAEIEQKKNNENPNKSQTVMLTESQKKTISQYKDEKQAKVNAIAVEILGNQFKWETCTEQQGEQILRKLKELHG